MLDESMDLPLAGSERELAGRRLLAVTEEELQRIVLDIHDGPVQNLFAALSQLSMARKRMGGFADASAACLPPLSSATQLLEAALVDIRDLLTAFRAPEFAALSVADIVEELAVQHETLTGEVVALEMSGQATELPLVIKIAFFRILQEALSNIRRHAGVPSALVRLVFQPGMLSLEIEDKGRGFSPPPLVGPDATEHPVHIGLRGMRDRAAAINGEFSVQSRPGIGTCVRVEVPLDG